MIRKQIYIEKSQDEKLKRLAATQGVTEAEVMRRALEAWAETDYSLGVRKDRILAVRDGAAVAYGAEMETRQGMERTTTRRKLDHEAWIEELAFMKQLAASNAGNTEGARAWTREDLYDKRRLRLPD